MAMLHSPQLALVICLAASTDSCAAQQPAAEQRVLGQAGRLWAGEICGTTQNGVESQLYPYRLCSHQVVPCP